MHGFSVHTPTDVTTACQYLERCEVRMLLKFGLIDPFDDLAILLHPQAPVKGQPSKGA